MLTRTHKILLGLLALQIALFALTVLGGGEPALVKARPLLPELDAAKVTRVRLFGDGAEKPGVELVKKGDAWIVASHFDHPADPAKVQGLLEPLARIAAGDPIATSASRHKQLRVADPGFDRKLVLDVEGGGERTLHIGSPVGARRTAIRVGGDAVHAATDVPSFVAEPAGFVETRYVDVPRAEIERIAIRREQRLIELAPVSEAWTATIDGEAVKLAPGEELDAAAIERLIGQIAAIDLRAPGDPKRDASQATAAITLHRKGVEQPISLDVVADGESYWVRQQGVAHAAVVDKAQLADAVGIDRDKLVKAPGEPAPASDAGGAGGPPAAPLPFPMPPPTP